jgi:6-phosphogluconolactonase
MNGEVRVVDDVPQAFAELVASVTPSSIALSGGETARDCYEQLASAAVDWPAVSVFMGDERWVEVDDPESNEGMAREVLLDRVEPRTVHSMRNAGSTADAAATAYDTLVRDAPPIDVVHLGLGPDGHTASLFPRSAALLEHDRFVVTNGDDLHPHLRLTFTYPAITRSRLVIFTVVGADKVDALARVRAGDDVPATRVQADQVIWLVDPASAGTRTQ